MTAPLNKSLGLICYIDEESKPNAICFVGDLALEPMEQAENYLDHENIYYDEIVFAMWHNALEDEYGNRYQPVIKQIG